MNTRTLLLFPALLISYEMATYLSNDMFLPALPQMMADLNLNQATAQMTLTSWFLGSASMQLILGPISDKFGRRPILLLGGVFFIIASVICALSQTLTTLLIARFIQGTTVCSVIVAGYASIHELFDNKQAMKTLAWMNSITILAPAFGPLIGSIILVGIFHSWRLIFWLLAASAFVSLILLYHYMPESHPKEKRQTLHLGTLLKNYGAILKNRGFLTRCLAFCLGFGGLITWLAAGPFLVTQTFQESVVMFGIYQLVIFTGFIIGTRLTKRWLDTKSPHRILSTGIILSLMGSLIGLAWSYVNPHIIYGLIVGITLFATGTGISFAPLNRLAIAACVEPMGARMAIFSSLMSAFGVAGSMTASLFYTSGSFSLASLFVIISVLTCIVLYLMPRDDKQTT